ncbi:DNA N-glycosylase and apurinic/apyrimidinic (AP) lyase [Linnemannia exigua]|uniref:Endonuclease III homolog n=1 Tax=Linnemannia exigua TaxID=604196 RepID=A0AAD4H365_9FUNG|nr:DNA N-glycosylase and apurinic/apyrimidinic (AP) lyase [Linnemannia exigua]
MISNSNGGSNAALATETPATKTNDDITIKSLKDATSVKAAGSVNQDMELKQTVAMHSPTAPSTSSLDTTEVSLEDGGDTTALGVLSSSSSPALAGMATSATITTQDDHLNENNKRLISLTAQWNGKKLPFEVDLDYTIGELKNKLMELTNVEPKRQKLMLVRGKLPDDNVVLSSLSLKNNQTFLMMGTPEAKVIKAPEVMPDVLNDLEEDYTPDDEAFASMAQNQKSLRSTIAKCDINIMHPLRPGKKLLVLDLDYTLIDCKALNNPLIEVMRPGLHEFLSVCYEEYDIVIWSQTSWRALEAKVTTIGLLTHADYKISFVMDISTMFSVLSQRDGKPFKHQVKALDIIYSKFPQFSAKNTIHVDDLSRNFAMNPKSGIKIGAFKNGAVSRHTDRELFHLASFPTLELHRAGGQAIRHLYLRNYNQILHKTTVFRMATRSSSRLSSLRVKAEQNTSAGEAKTNSTATKTTTTTTATNTSARRTIVKNEDGEPDAETLARLKLEADDHRKALASEKSRSSSSKRSNSAISSSTSSTGAGPSAGAVKKSKFATKEPVGWELTLDRLREFRLQNPAPVDTMGCERLAEVGDHIPPEVSRYQTLVALMLSSQTKDTVTSVAVRKLQKELKGGLTIQSILDVPSEELNSMIGAVGFHNKKTIYLKQVAEICRDQYHGDIPDTAEALIALPGVGPKMAYLTLQCAWNKNLGIGVDVHVHRIANRLGWVKTEKDGPEGTREALQSWLPKEHWREINHIMVGFGQVLCLPRGPICAACPVQERCPSATGITKHQKKKLMLEASIKAEREEPFGEVEIHHVHIKAEEDHKEGIKKEKVEEVNGETYVKKEKVDSDTSPYFEQDDVNVKKEEEILEAPSSLGVNGSKLKDTSQLARDSADIEDLIP